MIDLTGLSETIWRTAAHMHWAEVGAVLAGIVYVVLAARENIWCWFFGIIGSGLSIYLFLESRLYAEAFLYLYYVAAGFYGWYAWTHGRQPDDSLAISRWDARRHLICLLGGVVLSLMLALVLRRFTDAQMPILDAHTTIFSFLATFMATRKILENWIYWIVIDSFSVYLYSSRDLYLYALLMLVYTGIAWYGYRSWKKAFQGQRIGEV